MDILHQGPWFRVRNDDKLATYPELKDIVMEGCLTLIVCETTGLWTGAMLLILPGESASLAGHLLWNRHRQAHHPIRTSNEASSELHVAEKLHWVGQIQGLEYALDMYDIFYHMFFFSEILGVYIGNEFWKSARLLQTVGFHCSKVFRHRTNTRLRRPARLRNLRKWFDINKSRQAARTSNNLQLSQTWTTISLFNISSVSICLFSPLKHSPSPPPTFTKNLWQLQARCHRGGSGTHEFLERTSRRPLRNDGIGGSTGRWRWFVCWLKWIVLLLPSERNII